MIDAALMVVVLGTAALALAVDVAVLVAAVRRGISAKGASALLL
jgi:hypothetical protein